MRIEVPHRIAPEMVLEIRQSWERLGLSSESQGFQVHEFLRDVGDILRGEGVAKVQPPHPPQWEYVFSFCELNDLNGEELKEIMRGWRLVQVVLIPGGDEVVLVLEREVQHG